MFWRQIRLLSPKALFRGILSGVMFATREKHDIDRFLRAITLYVMTRKFSLENLQWLDLDQ